MPALVAHSRKAASPWLAPLGPPTSMSSLDNCSRVSTSWELSASCHARTVAISEVLMATTLSNADSRLGEGWRNSGLCRASVVSSSVDS